MNNLPSVTLPGVLRSKRFLTALTGTIVALIVAVAPEFEPHADQLLTLITILFGLPVAGFSLEDAAVAFKAGSEKSKYLD